jgi:hypothetical protein
MIDSFLSGNSGCGLKLAGHLHGVIWPMGGPGTLTETSSLFWDSRAEVPVARYRFAEL